MTDGATLTWGDLLDRCSRLHTTRTRPVGPWEGAEMREDSRQMFALAGGRFIRIVPTRMHEPGFYFWHDDKPCRSQEDLDGLRHIANTGALIEVIP